MNIDRIKSTSKLETVTTRPDIRRDLHVFTAYARQREMKRGHRDNAINKTDARRLAKLLSDPEAEAEVKDCGYSSWLVYVDGLAHQLGLVRYDTVGSYAGYTSQEPCFPDNYIQYDEQACNALVSMNLASQETQLLENLLSGHQGGGSEFYSSPFGPARLDRFQSWGSATGVMPTLDFTAIRRFLLGLLARCGTGEWLSVASFVEYLKANHRYFLIPKKPQIKNTRDQDKGRYQNFREGKGRWDRDIEIKETDPDAFERVEGRYVERFLEGLPHLLGYVDVAYGPPKRKGIYPSLSALKAFRVSERLQRALQGTITEPTLRVTPSFDLYLQSELYPARTIGELQRICEHVTEDTTHVFRLQRQRVAAACADDANLDVIALLESLATEPLPANVRRELLDWSAHSDKFVLYSGCSLLETNKQESDLGRYRVENISAGVDVVRSPDRLYTELEKQQLAPLRVKHGEKSFSPMPAKASSVFAGKAKAKKKKREPKTKVTLMRVTRVELLCPDRKFLDRMQRLLSEVSCPVEADRKRLSLAFSSKYDPEVNRALRELKKEYEVKIDDQ
jgi:hypothetical protein